MHIVYSLFLLGMKSADLSGVTTAQQEVFTNKVKGA